MLLSLTITAGTLLAFFAFNRASENQAALIQTDKTAKAAKPTEVSAVKSKMLFVGDVFWGRYINDWSQSSQLKYAYPFSKLSEFDRSNYDVWIGNLECPSIYEEAPYSSAKQDDLLSFNCDPQYMPEAKKWFDVFSLANNHTDNRNGSTGLEETRANLDKNKIQHFGHFDPEVYADVCEIISVPVSIKMSDETNKKGALPMAFCGYHGVFKIPSADSLAVMKQYSKLMPVFAMPHAGVEYKPAPDQLKTDLYRRMIDNGADVVLGAHPHWVQSSEVYKNHLIIHSMGNFMFDQQYSSEVTRSANVQLTLSLDEYTATENLQKWLDLGNECIEYQDNCLGKAKTLKKLPLKFDYKIIAGDSSNKITRPADKAITSAVKQRLGWPAIVKELRPPYSAQP
jgi:hypothetical protein